MRITAPGIYELPADAYHADAALSSSGARKLLPPYCPALFKWHRENQQPHSRIFDFGHAAHKIVLGEGLEIVAIPFDDYRKTTPRVLRDEAHAEGKTPLLTHEHDQVHEMAAALRDHPAAALMVRPGKPEQSLFAKDEATGVMLRARIDWLPDANDDRMVLVDYKTTASAEPAAFARSVAKYGYYAQAAWYLDIVHALGIAEKPGFLFVAQEKQPPYLVTVFELDEYALRIGRRRNRKAIDLFAECTERDEWPGYGSGVETLTIPVWADDDEEIVIS